MNNNITVENKINMSQEKNVDPSAISTLNDPALNTKVSFNVVVNWGEEWKLCKGDAYPESVAAQEGELDIPASDFEDLLTYEEKLEFNSLLASDNEIEESLRLQVEVGSTNSTNRMT